MDTDYVYINEHTIPRIFVEHIKYFENPRNKKLILEHPKFSSREIIQNFLKFSGICYVNRPDNRVIRGLHLKYSNIIPCEIDHTYRYDFDEIIKFRDKIEYVDIDDLSGITDLNFLIFVRFMPNITGEKINNLLTDIRDPDFRVIQTWDISKMRDFSYMFSNLPTFNENISGWNMENCERADHMFQNCYSFSQDLSKWNLKNCKSAILMFSGCIKLKLDDDFKRELNTVADGTTRHSYRFRSTEEEIYYTNTKLNINKMAHNDYHKKFAGQFPAGHDGFINIKRNQKDIDKFRNEVNYKLNDMREICRDFQDNDYETINYILHVPEKNKNLLRGANYDDIRDSESITKLLNIHIDKLQENTTKKEEYIETTDSRCVDDNYLN